MIKYIIDVLVSIYNKTHSDYYLSVHTYTGNNREFFNNLISTIEDDDIII